MFLDIEQELKKGSTISYTCSSVKDTCDERLQLFEALTKLPSLTISAQIAAGNIPFGR